MVRLEVQDLLGIKVTAVCLVMPDLLGQTGSRVPRVLPDRQAAVEPPVLKETKEQGVLRGWTESRETLVCRDFPVRTVYRQSLASPDPGVRQGPSGQKEKTDTKVYLGPPVPQDHRVQRDKARLPVRSGPKVQRESRGWTAQGGRSDLPVSSVQKETSVLRVSPAYRVWGLRVWLAPWDPRARKVPRGRREDQVSPVRPDLRDHLEPLT